MLHHPHLKSQQSCMYHLLHPIAQSKSHDSSHIQSRCSPTAHSRHPHRDRRGGYMSSRSNYMMGLLSKCSQPQSDNRNTPQQYTSEPRSTRLERRHLSCPHSFESHRLSHLWMDCSTRKSHYNRKGWNRPCSCRLDTITSQGNGSETTLHVHKSDIRAPQANYLTSSSA